MRYLLIVFLFWLGVLAVAQAPPAPRAAKKTAVEPTQAQLDAVPRITVEQLKHLLATDQTVVLIDARAPGSWGSSTTMMPGAIRVPPMEATKHLAELSKFKNRQVVAYCT